MGQKRPKMEHFSHPGRLVDISWIILNNFELSWFNSWSFEQLDECGWSWSTDATHLIFSNFLEVSNAPHEVSSKNQRFEEIPEINFSSSPKENYFVPLFRIHQSLRIDSIYDWNNFVKYLKFSVLYNRIQWDISKKRTFKIKCFK